MARGPRYRVPFRRRREGKTDYALRRALVVSRLPRLVVRSTLKHTIVQFFEAKARGDETIVSAHSQELSKDYGWRGACRNVPAAYLTGLLCGFRAKAEGVEMAVLDVGLHSPSRGARVFASLLGVLDAGIRVPHNESVLPDESRVSGQHIVEYANQLSLNPETYKRQFSTYLLRKMNPEQLSEHFSLVKERVVSSLEAKET